MQSIQEYLKEIYQQKIDQLAKTVGINRGTLNDEAARRILDALEAKAINCIGAAILIMPIALDIVYHTQILDEGLFLAILTSYVQEMFDAEDLGTGDIDELVNDSNIPANVYLASIVSAIARLKRAKMMDG